MRLLFSDQHNSVALFKTDFFKDPNLPNVHCKSVHIYIAELGKICLLKPSRIIVTR